MKIEPQFHPIYVQDAGMNVAITEKDIIKYILDAIVARADLVFCGEDGCVTYRPLDITSEHRRGWLNIQL